MNKIKRVSLFFRIVFQIIFISLPLDLIISWIYAPDELVLMNGFIQFNPVPAPYRQHILQALSASEKISGALVSAIPMIVNLFVLYFLIKLFKLYEKGEIFSLHHVRYIRNIGYTLLVGQVIQPFYQFAMGLVLTLNNPPHHRFASITMDQNNIGILLTALLIILISWIMAEGCKLQEDQQLTI